MNRPVVLLIRDGWGVGPRNDGNAVAKARTPNMDRLLAAYPRTVLQAAGEAVGVRPGAQGSSEVGHLNIGAGRVVEQEILRVDKLISSGEIYKAPLLVQAAENCRKNDSKLHLMGLVQDQGVHATEEHLWALLEFAKRQGLKKVYVHFFADGRDTPPRSALVYLDRLEKKFREIGVGKVASVIGRYWAMDRGKNWDRTKAAYDALTAGKGLTATSARAAIESAYARADEMLAKRGSQQGQAAAGYGAEESEEPQGELIETDEFIQPTLIVDGGKPVGLIEPGDSVIHFNYRQDRAIQLTRAFVEDNFKDFDRGPRPAITYIGLTKYYDTFKNAVVAPMNMSNLLGEVISAKGLYQLRISEYQKYRHVTSFFNGKSQKPYVREDRIQVPSINIPENQQPEMSAAQVTELVLAAIKDGIAAVRAKAAASEGVTVQFDGAGDEAKRLADTYDLIVLNYANCDMVGHTGDFDAGVKAVETVDACVGQVCDAVLARDGAVLVTADHGNVEQMIDPATGSVQTAHTTNVVEFVLVCDECKKSKLIPEGKLSDIAPTILQLLGMPAPKEMTAVSLIAAK